jgi:hypothetical protein
VLGKAANDRGRIAAGDVELQAVDYQVTDRHVLQQPLRFGGVGREWRQHRLLSRPQVGEVRRPSSDHLLWSRLICQPAQRLLVLSPLRAVVKQPLVVELTIGPDVRSGEPVSAENPVDDEGLGQHQGHQHRRPGSVCNTSPAAMTSRNAAARSEQCDRQTHRKDGRKRRQISWQLLGPGGQDDQRGRSGGIQRGKPHSLMGKQGQPGGRCGSQQDHCEPNASVGNDTETGDAHPAEATVHLVNFPLDPVAPNADGLAHIAGHMEKIVRNAVEERWGGNLSFLGRERIHVLHVLAVAHVVVLVSRSLIRIGRALVVRSAPDGGQIALPRQNRQDRQPGADHGTVPVTPQHRLADPRGHQRQSRCAKQVGRARQKGREPLSTAVARD